MNNAGGPSRHPPESGDLDAGARAASLAPEIRRRLLQAYDEGKRELPWRGETDPYRVWVSEIMLQQTRVETVIPYYKAWLDRFPTLESLAEAGEEEVLRLWQGLGYYSRARNLHKGARVVRERFRGNVPEDPTELRSLPGVGEYTAGALASIAFGVAAPAVDGNVRRVLSRLFDLPDPGRAELREMATALVDPDRPGDFNQALMELGALVCTPRSPDCGGCPLTGSCAAYGAGTVEERPARKEKKPVPEVEVVVLVAVVLGGSGFREGGAGAREGGGAGTGEEDLPGDDGGPRFFLRRRPPEGLLAGLWEFPGVEVGEGGMARTGVGTTKHGVGEPGAGLPERRTSFIGAAVDLARQLGLVPDGHGAEVGLERSGGPLELPAVPHAFSHLKARYWPVLVPVAQAGAGAGEGRRVDAGRGDGGAPEAGWFTPEEISQLPLPVAQQKILSVAWSSLR